MGGNLSMSLSEVTSNWPLIRYLIDQTEYKQLYDGHVYDFITKTFTPELMQPEYARLRNLIEPYVTGANGESKPYSFLNSNGEFDSAHSYLNSHVQNRVDAALDYLY